MFEKYHQVNGEKKGSQAPTVNFYQDNYQNTQNFSTKLASTLNEESDHVTRKIHDS